MDTLDHIIDRLEMRNMAVAGLHCTWCPCCLRVSLKDPAIKRGGFELIWPGEEECRQPVQTGTIRECIVDLRDRP